MLLMRFSLRSGARRVQRGFARYLRLHRINSPTAQRRMIQPAGLKELSRRRPLSKALTCFAFKPVSSVVRVVVR